MEDKVFQGQSQGLNLNFLRDVQSIVMEPLDFWDLVSRNQSILKFARVRAIRYEPIVLVLYSKCKYLCMYGSNIFLNK